MKTLLLKNLKRVLLVSVSVCTGWTFRAEAVTSPSSSVVQVFEMRASVNSDCSNAVTVFKTATPSAVDLMANPTFGSGAIPDGTYHCVMFRINDLISIVPQSTTAGCSG